MKRNWTWSIKSEKGTFTGTVQAVDPRDALSRALTSDAPSGHLQGQFHGVDVNVIQGVPCNSDVRYVTNADSQAGAGNVLLEVWVAAEGRFAVGDVVTREYRGKVHTGVVEATVAAGKYPTDSQRKEADAYGQPRDHVSYLVREGKSETRKGKLYWPPVSALQRA